MKEKTIDIHICRLGMQQLEIFGYLQSYECFEVVDSVIAAIEKAPRFALMSKYLCITRSTWDGGSSLSVVKSPYGFKPERGEVVFSIKRKKRDLETPLGDNEMYLLKAFKEYSISNNASIYDTLEKITALQREADSLLYGAEYGNRRGW